MLQPGKRQQVVTYIAITNNTCGGYYQSAYYGQINKRTSSRTSSYTYRRQSNYYMEFFLLGSN